MKMPRAASAFKRSRSRSRSNAGFASRSKSVTTFKTALKTALLKTALKTANLIRLHHAIAPGIRARFDHTAGSHPHHARRGTARPAGTRADLMPAAKQILQHVLRRAVVQLE